MANTFLNTSDIGDLTITPTKLSGSIPATKLVMTDLSIATTQLTGIIQATQFPALSGDISTTAGSLVTTLATVNTTPGVYGSVSNTLSATVNAKGLITSLSASSIQITESQVTSLVTDLASKANLSGATFTGPVTLSADPTSALMAATKNYVDQLINGLNWKHSVVAATTTALPAYTVDGTKTILTATVNGAFPVIDGVTLNLNDGLLVKNETGINQPNNGGYSLTQAGSVSAPWILTRRADSNTSSLLLAATYYVLNGTVEQNRVYAINVSPITMGTTNITFALIAGPSTYTNGSGILLSGNVFSLDTTYTKNLFSATTATGITYTAATGVFALSAIPNSSLTNSTISGTALGGTLPALTIGTGLSGVSYNGSTASTIANTGVLSFSAGTTGLTPSTATTGAITLAGTLAIANGGTGQSTALTLQNITTNGNTSNTGIQLTENGNLAASYALYLKRNTDVSPLGYIIQAQNAAANANIFTVDASGNIIATTLNASLTNTLTFGSGLVAGSYNNSSVQTISIATAGVTNAMLANSTISGVALGGSLAAFTMNNSGTGAASGTTFNGSVAQTISYNTIGAPSTTGANASGTWGISITGNAATVTNGIYTTSSFNLGTTSIALNRASASQSLTGVSIDGTAGSENLATVTNRNNTASADIITTSHFISKGGASNAIGAGALFAWDNGLGGTSDRQTLFQYNASFGLDYYFYNGTAWSSPLLTIDNTGAITKGIWNAGAVTSSGNGVFSGSITGGAASFTTGAFSLGTVGGAIGSVKNATVTNTNGAIGDWAGYNFSYYNNTTNFAYIGTVLTSVTTNGTADLVFGTKADINATAATEYFRLKSGGNFIFATATGGAAGTFQASGTTPYWQFLSSGTATANFYVGYGTSLLTGAAATDVILRSDNALRFAAGGNQNTLTLNANQSATFFDSVNAINGNFSIYQDATYVYLQSFASKPLQINSLGNNIIFASGTVGINGSTGAISGTSAIFSSSITATSFIGNLNNSLTFNNGGAGAASGTVFNNSAAQTISYNTIGAFPTTGGTLSGAVTATNFTKTGGTSTQGMLANGSNITLNYGTYTPTLTNVQNATGFTAATCQWMQVGSVVTVSGEVSLTVNASTQVIFTMSLPSTVANFASSTQLGGTGVHSHATNGQVAYQIFSTVGAQTAKFSALVDASTSESIWFSFTYLQ